MIFVDIAQVPSIASLFIACFKLRSNVLHMFFVMVDMNALEDVVVIPLLDICSHICNEASIWTPPHGSPIPCCRYVLQKCHILDVLLDYYVLPINRASSSTLPKFLGYSPSHKRYQRLGTSCRIFWLFFKEFCFPYSKSFPSTTNNQTPCSSIILAFTCVQLY